MAWGMTAQCGFETGGGELLSSTSGTVTWPAAAARSGGYGCRMASGTTSITYQYPTITNGTTGIVISYNQLWADVTPASITKIFGVTSAFELSLLTDGKLRVTDNASVTTDSSSSVFTNATYSRIDILFDNGDFGAMIIHVDGSEVINIASGEFSNGVNLVQAQFLTTSDTGQSDIDDIYIGTGATGVGDFRGDYKIKGHQGPDTVTATPDFTNTGTTTSLIDLSVNDWEKLSYTPTLATGLAEYQDNNQWGAIAFDEENLNGQGPGPSGDSDYTGATIHAATYIIRMARGNGGGSDHFILHGKWSGSGDASITTGADLNPTTSQAIYTEFVTGGNIPAVTDYAVMGFEHSGGAGQNFMCGEMWVEIGYVEATATTHTGSLTAASTSTQVTTSSLTAVGDLTAAMTASLVAQAQNFKQAQLTSAAVGAMTLTASVFKEAVVTIAGTSTLVATGEKGLLGNLAAAGVASLSASAVQTVVGDLTAAAVGGLTVIGEKGLIGNLTAAAVGGLTAIAEVAKTGDLTVSAVATLSAIGERGQTGELTAAGVATLVPVPVVTYSGNITAASVASMVQTAQNLKHGQLTIAGAATITATATVTTGDETHLGVLTAAGVATLVATGEKGLLGNLTAAAVGGLTVTPSHTQTASALMAASMSLQATGEKGLLAVWTANMSASLAASGEKGLTAVLSAASTSSGTYTGQGTYVGSLSAAGVAAMSVQAVRTLGATLTAAGAATATLTGTVTNLAVTGEITVSATSSLALPSSVEHPASLTVAETAVLEFVAINQKHGSATYAAVATSTLLGGLVQSGVAVLTGTAAVTTSAVRVLGASFGAVGVGGLTATFTRHSLSAVWTATGVAGLRPAGTRVKVQHGQRRPPEASRSFIRK